MPEKNAIAGLAANLADNVRFLREKRGFTQSDLARLAELPRSTIASLETGSSNPTLSVLSRLALSLKVSIEELISRPRATCQKFPRGTLPIKGEGRLVMVSRLLPDPIPGMEIDRVELKPQARLKGTPHRPGTKEYFYCEAGEITLWVAGEKYGLKAGDVAAFPGDQAHSYHNDGARTAVGFGVVSITGGINP